MGTFTGEHGAGCSVIPYPTGLSKAAREGCWLMWAAAGGWGRWTIAAARAGYTPIGMDLHIDALEAASRVSRQVGVRADYVCADVEHLPFRSGSIDVFFSYSVLQHLERAQVMGF